MPFWCLPKNQQNFFRISTLASKKSSNQKNKGTLNTWLEDFILTLTLLFWFGLILEANTEILGKILLVFWETPKEHFKTDWPLTKYLSQTQFSKRWKGLALHKKIAIANKNRVFKSAKSHHFFLKILFIKQVLQTWQSSAYTVLWTHGFLNNAVFLSWKSALCF